LPHVYQVTHLINGDIAISTSYKKSYYYPSRAILILDAETGLIKKTLNGHSESVFDIVSLDNNTLASVAGYSARIWKI
jgi:WD40 repeat protein